MNLLPNKKSHSNLTDYLRKKTGGTNAISLVSGKKISKVEGIIVDDPFKLKTGGLVVMKNVKGTKISDDQLLFDEVYASI